jgi:hypothetical protein
MKRFSSPSASSRTILQAPLREFVSDCFRVADSTVFAEANGQPKGRETLKSACREIQNSIKGSLFGSSLASRRTSVICTFVDDLDRRPAKLLDRLSEIPTQAEFEALPPAEQEKSECPPYAVSLPCSS